MRTFFVFSQMVEVRVTEELLQKNFTVGMSLSENVCGLPAMAEDLYSMLKRMDVKDDQLRYEKLWREKYNSAVTSAVGKPEMREQRYYKILLCNSCMIRDAAAAKSKDKKTTTIGSKAS